MLNPLKNNRQKFAFKILIILFLQMHFNLKKMILLLLLNKIQLILIIGGCKKITMEGKFLNLDLKVT